MRNEEILIYFSELVTLHKHHVDSAAFLILLHTPIAVIHLKDS